MNKQQMLQIHSLLHRIHFDSDVIERILLYYKQHPSFIETHVITSYMGDLGEPCAYTITTYSPFVRLCTITALLPYIMKQYQTYHIPEHIILDTFTDVTLRLSLYQKAHHKDGLTKDDVIWFRHLMKVKMFKLHTLQFQIFDMLYLDESIIGVDYMQFDPEIKKRIPNNSPVINVHVQDGADLRLEEIETSFALAEEFFPTYFPEHEYKAFLCYSWLLNPNLKKYLPVNSNILAFASKYQIIAYRKETESLTTIYGKRYRSLKDYPQDTSLQRNLLHHFDDLGQCCGLRFRIK